GANNYGIVTSFTFQLYPTPPKVTSITLKYDINKIQTLFDAINKLGPTLPDDMYLFRITSECNASYETIISLSQPTSNQFTEETFFDSVVRWGHRQLNCTINPYHKPNNFKVKSFYVKSLGLSAEGVKSLVSFMKGLSITCRALASLELYAGSAATRVAANATAFVHGIFGETFQSNYTDYSSYQNYIDRDLTDWLHRYYGSNLPALIAVKKIYDPNNVFGYAQ
ncbi:3738_t:CDS:2, partial [Racocetra persica]